MMSIETMRELGKEIAKVARREGKVPMHVETNLTPGFLAAQLKRIPNLGPYVPKGWERVEDLPLDGKGVRDGTLFVDKSGLGLESEPALTFSHFVENVQTLIDADPEYAFAIIEEGQFQVYVGVFKRKKGAKAHAKGRRAAHPLPPLGKVDTE